MLRVVRVDQLRQAQGAGHAGGAAADYDYVGGHLGVFDIGDEVCGRSAFGLSLWRLA